MVIGAILCVAVVLFGKNNDYFIDRFGIHMSDWWIWMLLAAAVFIGVVFWVQGHRVYAVSKGRPALLGLALAFLVIVGLLILMVMPAKKRAPAAPSAEASPSAGGES
jgi:hypothetical protein